MYKSPRIINPKGATLEDARKGAKDIGRMLESKQLKANVSKSKFVVIGSKKSRTKIQQNAEDKPTQIGTHTLENSTAEKNLGDKIYEDGTAASITDTLNSKLPLAKKNVTRYLIYSMTQGLYVLQ